MSIQETVKPLAESYQDKLAQYSPFSICSDREYWDHIDARMREQLIEDGNQALNTDYPVIYASDYMDFTISGNRNNYETIYFKRRHILNKLILAECAENKGRYLMKIIDGIWLICEESSWVLPAHNTYIRDTPQIILPDTDRPVLDLFSCETAELLSMAVYLLKEQLDNVSPLICERVTRELEKRIIDSYINEHFWWMGNDTEPMCNWTVWCVQNVLLTAFLPNGLTLTDDIKHQILVNASYSIDCFLKDYGADGCCEEGAQYYRHAGLCLFGCLDILNAVSDNHFASLYNDPKIRNIAIYIYNMHVDGPYYFNFADCSPIAGKCGAREYLFGKATGQDVLMQFASEDYAAAYKDGSLLSDESQLLNLYYRTQSVYCLDEILKYYDESLNSQNIQDTQNEDASFKESGSPADMYYESVGIWIAKNRDLALAVKTGNNDDSHNHNDTGSLILYKNNSPVLVDIGVETYTKKTFSPDRYDIWTMQSCYHNLPTINGIDQSAGANYRATDIVISEDGSTSQISMNINAAYEGLNQVYSRKVYFDKDKSEIRLEDTTDYEDVILNFITYDKPTTGTSENDECECRLLNVGDAKLEWSGAVLTDIETLPITDPRLMKAWDHDLYRIRMKMTDKKFTMLIK